MAIEFNCPYCTATIRVPDAYGGKQGRCPKCDTRLLVPTVLRPDAAMPTTSAISGVASPPPTSQNIDAPTDVFQIKPVPTTSKKRSGRRRPSRALVIGIPVICFLVLLGLIFYSVTANFPQIGGEVVAKRLTEKNLPKITIPWADTGVTEEEQSILREFLSKTPETLASQVMTCRLIGTPAGLEVALTAGPESDWFAVDFGTNKPLALWLKNERSQLNVRRMQLLRKGLTDYCRDKLVQIKGDKIAINALSVRDHVGINATTSALGSVLLSTTGQLQIPCSYEDEKGSVYFCLPAGTLAFQIVGKTSAEGTKLFPGEFTAIVAPDAAPVPQSSDAAEPETPSEEGMKEGEPTEPVQEDRKEGKMDPDDSMESSSPDATPK